jgi:DnaK suppressor protein
VDAERARELLQAERARIEHSLGRLGHEGSDDLSDLQNPANQASDLFQDELDEGREDDLQEQLEAVARAEARLAAGTYGLSVESGEPISDERLEALPAAELTAEEERARSRS